VIQDLDKYKLYNGNVFRAKLNQSIAETLCKQSKAKCFITLRQ